MCREPSSGPLPKLRRKQQRDEHEGLSTKESKLKKLTARGQARPALY